MAHRKFLEKQIVEVKLLTLFTWFELGKRERRLQLEFHAAASVWRMTVTACAQHSLAGRCRHVELQCALVAAKAHKRDNDASNITLTPTHSQFVYMYVQAEECVLLDDVFMAAKERELNKKLLSAAKKALDGVSQA